MSEVSEAQHEFDTRYITGAEIMQRLGITRTALHNARSTGKLPDAIDIQGQMYIWLRDSVEPYLSAWKMVLDTRRATMGGGHADATEQE